MGRLPGTFAPPTTPISNAFIPEDPYAFFHDIVGSIQHENDIYASAKASFPGVNFEPTPEQVKEAARAFKLQNNMTEEGRALLDQWAEGKTSGERQLIALHAALDCAEKCRRLREQDHSQGGKKRMTVRTSYSYADGSRRFGK